MEKLKWLEEEGNWRGGSEKPTQRKRVIGEHGESGCVGGGTSEG